MQHLIVDSRKMLSRGLEQTHATTLPIEDFHPPSGKTHPRNVESDISERTDNIQEQCEFWSHCGQSAPMLRLINRILVSNEVPRSCPVSRVVERKLLYCCRARTSTLNELPVTLSRGGCGDRSNGNKLISDRLNQTQFEIPNQGLFIIR